MTRRWLALACLSAIGLLGLGAGLPLKPMRFAAGESLAGKPRVVADVALPAGFAATVDRVTRDQFVGVVAGDLDHDGDLDVVASLGSLDLAVWRNDGAGHFTRLPFARHSSLRPQPAAPAVDGDLDSSSESIQTRDSRDSGVESRRARAADDPLSPLTLAAPPTVDRFGPRARSSRAPPRA